MALVECKEPVFDRQVDEILGLLEEGIERSEIAEKLGYKNPMSLDNYMRRRNFSWDSRQKMFVLRPSATRQSCIAISCRCMVHRRRRLSSPNSRRTVRTRRKSRDKQVLPAIRSSLVI